MEYSACDWEANINAGVANGFTVGGGDVNSEFRCGWIGRFGILRAVGGFILRRFFLGSGLILLRFLKNCGPRRARLSVAPRRAEQEQCPNCSRAAGRGRYSPAQIELHIASLLLHSSDCLNCSVRRARSSCFKLSAEPSGGVSLRAIDAAADSPKRMIALTENIRFIFIQEEAWGFRPTPSMWARSPIR
jgi:hypothetical protein